MSKSWQERLWRRAGLHALGLRMEDYERYLEGPHWQEFRKLALAEQKKEWGHNYCESCLQNDHALHVHHRTYERLGKEMLTDVSIVCEPCHDKIHFRDEQSRKRNYAPGFHR